MNGSRILAAGAAIFAFAAPLHAAIYVKIPDIDGESTRAEPGVEPDEIDVKMSGDDPQARNSGDAHLDYLVITLAKATAAHEAAHIVQQRTSSKTSHEPTGDAGLQWGDTVPLAQALAPERLRHRDRATSAVAPRDAATGLATGKRQHRPPIVLKPIEKGSPVMLPESTEAGSVTIAGAFERCSVGRSYPHVVLGDDEAGKEAKLLGVTVAHCASEEFTLNYEKIAR